MIERVKYWTAYVRSGLNYPATQALPDSKTNSEILSLQAKVLGTTGWLHENSAAQVYQALNIVSADTAEQSLELNMILAVVREHCKIVICGGRAEQPKTIEAYRRLRGEANYDSTASNDLSKIMASDGPNKYFAKMSRALFKETNRRINTKEAEYHLQTKFNQ